MKRLYAVCAAMLLGGALVIGLSVHSRAQAAPECGALSTWNGQTCIGPRGKAYCPENMTLQNNVCVSTMTPMATSATNQTIGANLSGSDHARIIAMLATLTNMVSQQQATINDMQQKMIALQINLNLANMNVEKARVAAMNDGDAIANLQASLAGMPKATTPTNTGANIQSSLATMQSSLAQLGNAQSAQGAMLTDVQHRQAIMCHMITELNVPEIKSFEAQSTACNGSWWNPDATKGYLSQAIPFKY